MLLAFAILTVMVFFVLSHIVIVQIFGSHARFQAHADEKVQDVAELLVNVGRTQLVRIFPPLEIDFLQKQVEFENLPSLARGWRK